MSETRARPNPDALLAHIQSEEQRRERGRLKIFLGYAAGVGKTYAMLEAAAQRKAEGVDVVCGYVETHQRAETEQMLAGLEVVPRRQVEHRGVLLPEMDVDAVLARRPGLALVDELAHTNAPGSRHPKRYQDVEELLEAGIGVYSTLNVQHLESLNDIVAQITGVTVRETVPDRILDEASEIELIDLPPAELLQRLRDGKIYVPEQAERAIDKFFRQGNLTALRELSMRRAAERVDDQMSAYMQTRAIAGPWPATEHLLVCLSPGMLSERLVRTGRRLADQLNADWHALNVQTPGAEHLSPAYQDRLARTLRLAEELGARVVTLPGSSVAETVLEYAREHNITKIIAGKPLRSRWNEWLRHDLVEQIIRRSGHIDVYVISGSVERTPAPAEAQWRPHHPLGRYAQGVALVVGVTLLGELVSSYISPTNLVMLYLLAVVIAASWLGRGPSIIVSILSVMAFDFFFVPPILTFIVSDTEYLLTFGGLLAVSLVISQLTVRVREQAEAAQRRQTVTATLFALSRDLAIARNLEEVVDAVIRNITQTFGREVAILLPEGESGDNVESGGAATAVPSRQGGLAGSGAPGGGGFSEAGGMVTSASGSRSGIPEWNGAATPSGGSRGGIPERGGAMTPSGGSRGGIPESGGAMTPSGGTRGGLRGSGEAAGTGASDRGAATSWSGSRAGTAVSRESADGGGSDGGVVSAAHGSQHEPAGSGGMAGAALADIDGGRHASSSDADAAQPASGMRAGIARPASPRAAAAWTGVATGGDSRLHAHGLVPDFAHEQNELAVATWAFQHDQEAGRGSETLPASAARYLPLKTARGVVGVIGVKPVNPDAVLTPDEHRLLEAFASLAALAIERVHLAEVARNAQVLAASEKLQTALLNSISHDLRTPLVSVTGSLTALSEEGSTLDEATRRELIDTARGEAERLNRLVGNLLDMTRIEAGAMKIDRQPSDVQEVIGTALEQLNSRLGARPVRVDVPPDLPLAPLDPALMMHVLINLIDNALKYSPAGAPIEISARANGANVEIAVSDRGIGIPPDALERVFDKFYRVQHPQSAGGTGLGLSICKGIIEAHGGTIRAAQRPGGGTTLTISLPLYGGGG